jgi:signal transduction histidine kinase
MIDDLKYIRYFNLKSEDINPDIFSPDEKTALDRINQKIAARDTLLATMDFFFETSLPVFKSDRIGLAFVEENQERIFAHWARATYEPLILAKGYTEDLEGSSLEQVIKKGHIRIINDLEQYAADHPQSVSTKMLIREGVQSSLTAPLILEGETVGVLFRSSKEKNAFSEIDAMKHFYIAERLAQAVEKTWMYEKLKQAYNAYFEMLGFVSHELKSPVASIVTDGRLLTQGYLGDLQDNQKQKIEKMILKGEYLLGLVKEYLDLARIEGGELKPTFKKNVDFISEIIELCIELEKSNIDLKQMKLTGNYKQDKVFCECDPDLMRTVMVNFIGNAIKYGNEKGEVRITINISNHSMKVAVWNEGPGFPESERKNLFIRFSRIKTPELLKRKGTGIGLYSSWRIIKLHHGKVQASSEEGKWAEFSFEIPQPIPSDQQGLINS